jgi:hypothetical protein
MNHAIVRLYLTIQHGANPVFSMLVSNGFSRGAHNIGKLHDADQIGRSYVLAVQKTSASFALQI